MQAIDHLVHIQATGPKQGDHGVCLGSDWCLMGDAVLGTLSGVKPLVSQVASKRGLIDKKECTATEILRVGETLSLFGLQRNVGGAILIEKRKAQFFQVKLRS